MGLDHFPDGEYLKPMELTCVEEHLKESIAEKYTDRVLTIAGRTAHPDRRNKPGAGQSTVNIETLYARLPIWRIF